MSSNTKQILVSALTALVVVGLVLWIASARSAPAVGAIASGTATTFTAVNSTTGYQVAGTDVIDSSGNFLGGFTGSTATFTGAVAASSTLQVSGVTTLYSTTTAANVVLTTSNTATSSLQVGCVQTTATSTATPNSLTFFATTTVLNGTAVTASNGLTPAGFVIFSYGKCPRV